MHYGRLSVAEAQENLDETRDDLKEALLRWRLSYQPLVASPFLMFGAVLCGNIDWLDTMGVFIVLSVLTVFAGSVLTGIAFMQDAQRDKLRDARKAVRAAETEFMEAIQREVK